MALHAQCRSACIGRGFIDLRIIEIGTGRKHDAIIVMGALPRHAAFGHIALHHCGLALQRVAPAATTGGDDLHDLPREHRLAIDQTA